ncbi:MAG: hypothetical protein K6F11_02940 [Lachnospiraceae bacterium]|nr:hypothetical protein [Lachnospiraceae bacterium]
MKRSILCVVILLVALCAVACGPKREATEEPTVTPTTATVTATPTVEESTPTPTPTEVPVSTPTPTEDIINSDEVPEDSGLYRVELSGKKEDHFISTRYCYIESEKYYLLLDKDIDLPGDFTKQTDLLVDTLEEVIGLSYLPDFNPPEFNIDSYYPDKNPWRDMDFKEKIPIFIIADREARNLFSNASESYMVLVCDELMSEELWNSIPVFRDNPLRRHDFIPYITIAHELTHVITLRHGWYTLIMSEGSGDYFAEKVLKMLSDQSTDFAESVNSSLYFNTIQDKLTPQNAEQIFIDDYSDLYQANSADKYTLGRLICIYLAETYGDSFFRDYAKAVTEAGFPMATDEVPSGSHIEKTTRQAEVLKSLFGNDFFIKFGKWYQTRKY